MSRSLFAFFTAIAAMASFPASAQDGETPYWASLRADEVYMRVGPSVDYKIDWVYRRRGLPVKILRVLEGWRLVQDQDGTQGWIAQRLLSRSRGAIVIGSGLAAMRERPDASSQLRWNLEPGVVGQLGECQQGWCELNVDGRTGFVQADQLWGDGQP